MKKQISEQFKRMQLLAGIITEDQYKKRLNESVLQENLWDKIKDVPKKLMSKLKGGAPAIMASALVDCGLGVGKYFYWKEEKDTLGRSKIKSVDYNTGDVDMTFELSNDGGVNWVVDDAKGLKTALGFEEELSGLSSKSPEELKTWYDKTVEGAKKEFAKGLVTYDINKLLNNPGLSLAESAHKAVTRMINEALNKQK